MFPPVAVRSKEISVAKTLINGGYTVVEAVSDVIYNAGLSGTSATMGVHP